MNESKLKPEPARNVAKQAPESPDFSEVVNLLAVLSEAAARLALIEGKANSALLELIDDQKDEYADLQSVATRSETALEAICRRHPEWFALAKSIKTPYGKVAFRTGTSLQVKDDEATVRLLKAVLGEAAAKDYIRTLEVPNLEALEKLPDVELARVMVKRVATDVFSATPAKVDFGKAVKEAVGGK